ncbi:MAG: hypothetical protein FWE62_03820, partial [Firmicutes bacterium]|nr:hypothetical protein [Bacillota bacterium]
ERQYLIEPDGVTYVIGNTSGGKTYPASTGSDLPAFMQQQDALAINTQPDFAMFGAVSVRDSALLYEAYTVNAGGAATLYDHVGVIRDAGNVPAAIPKITAQPESQLTDAAGAAVSLSVTAQSPDGGALSYQWYGSMVNGNQGGTAITGAVGASYDFNAGAYPFYYAVITNTTGGKTASRASSVASVGQKISPVALTVTAPVAGAVPSTEITDGEGFSAALSWSNNPAVFKEGVTYTAWVTLSAKPGFVFQGYTDTAAIAGFAINGITPAFISGTANTLMFAVTFPETGKEESSGCNGAGVSQINAAALFVILGAVLLLKRKA